MRSLKQSTARNVMVFMTDLTDPTAGLEGLTLAVTISKDGGAFAAMSGGAATDRGDGWYSVPLDATDTDTLGDLAMHITASGANPTDVLMDVVTLFEHENVLIDNTTNTVDGLTAARVRVFADAAAAAAATIDAGGLEGAVASYTMESTYESPGKLASYRLVKD